MRMDQLRCAERTTLWMHRAGWGQPAEGRNMHHTTRTTLAASARTKRASLPFQALDFFLDIEVGLDALGGF